MIIVPDIRAEVKGARGKEAMSNDLRSAPKGACGLCVKNSGSNAEAAESFAEGAEERIRISKEEDVTGSKALSSGSA